MTFETRHSGPPADVAAALLEGTRTGSVADLRRRAPAREDEGRVGDRGKSTRALGDALRAALSGRDRSCWVELAAQLDTTVRACALLGRPVPVAAARTASRTAEGHSHAAHEHRLASHRSVPQHFPEEAVRAGPPVRSAGGAGIPAGLDRQARPGPAGRRAASGRGRAGADLPGQEVRCHDRPARAEGGAGVRPRQRRDRGAHPGPAQPHRPRHP